MGDRPGQAGDPRRAEGAVLNFFERQRAARGTTLKLVVLFALAVLSIVVLVDLAVVVGTRGHGTVGWVIAATIITLAIMLGGTAGKLVALRGGGAAVAQSLGATAVDPATTDPRLRRFVNVVEEMSIASGVPVPRLFVLESEPGINAFAAGFSPADAAVTVTSGALDTLNRDELQGVIGHEFSHVLNGDMRLNVRLIGLLYGILLLGLVGLRFLQFGGGRSRDSKNGNPLLLFAIALAVLGFVGRFFAGLIQAAVSRQREWLADASAVQFTRQTTGLAGALKKIAGIPAGSALRDQVSERQVSHMLFGEGKRSFSQLYATHPPLLERIGALEPGFDAEAAARLQQAYAEAPPNGLAEDARMGLAPSGTARPTPPTPAPSVRVEPAEMSARVGTFTPEDLDRGARLSGQLPADLLALARQQSTAVPLVLALLVHDDPQLHERQLLTVSARLGRPVADAVDALAPRLRDLPLVLRLPLVAVASPQLAARPDGERVALGKALDELVRADGVVTVFEYCLTRTIGAYLSDTDDPLRRSRSGRGSFDAAAYTLLAAVAAAGNADPAAAEHAFDAAITRLRPGRAIPFRPPGDPWRALDDGWATLNALDPRNKQVLVEALVAAVADDGVVTAAEAELLRTACTMLRCPLPPLVA